MNFVTYMSAPHAHTHTHINLSTVDLIHDNALVLRFVAWFGCVSCSTSNRESIHKIFDKDNFRFRSRFFFSIKFLDNNILFSNPFSFSKWSHSFISPVIENLWYSCKVANTSIQHYINNRVNFAFTFVKSQFCLKKTCIAWSFNLMLDISLDLSAFLEGYFIKSLRIRDKQEKMKHFV